MKTPRASGAPDVDAEALPAPVPAEASAPADATPADEPPADLKPPPAAAAPPESVAPEARTPIGVTAGGTQVFAAPAAPTTKTVEAWAELKGDLRPGWDPSNRYVSPRFAHEPPQHFNVAKFLEGWAHGREVTEAEYVAAIEKAARVTAG